MHTPIVVQPMQWASIPDISEVDPLSAADRDCIREIRDVLARHGRLDRFGINLIHKHFDIAEDECLVESIDEATRTLTVRPEKKSYIGKAIETQWQLTDGAACMLCRQYCDPPGGHPSRHNIFY